MPFVFSGVVVCLALTRFPDRVEPALRGRPHRRRRSAASLLVIAAVASSTARAWSSSSARVAALGALVFASDAAAGGGSRRWPRWRSCCSAASRSSTRSCATDGDALLRIIWAKERARRARTTTRSGTPSRASPSTATATPATPVRLRASAPRCPPDTSVHQLGMVIDSTAGTVLTRYTGDPTETDFLRYDITNLAHYAAPGRRRPGDRRRRRARHPLARSSSTRSRSPASRSTATSSTSRTASTATSPVTSTATRGSIRQRRGPQLPRARPTSATTSSRSRSSTPGRRRRPGAFALSENSLYTTEAWKLFFDRLKPGGVLSVSRWYDDRRRASRSRRTAPRPSPRRRSRPRRERTRATTSSIYQGPPSRRSGSDAATLLVSPEPFSPGRHRRRCDAQARPSSSSRRVLTPDARDRSEVRRARAPGRARPRRSTGSTRTSRRPPTTGRSSSRWPTSTRS